MGSKSYLRWKSEAKSRLDELTQAHAKVGGSARGRRVATLQINHALAVLLSSNFQGYCRDLHTEAIDYLCKNVSESWARKLFWDRLAENRRLDRGNPTPGNLGSDFNRLGLGLWEEMRRRDARSALRQTKLEQLCKWRNAIAHQDFSNASDLDLGSGRLHLRLKDVTDWRSTCDALASTLDRVTHAHVAKLVGTAPWTYPGI